MSLEDGIRALQQQQYSEAIQLLENYCKDPSNQNSPTYIQALMGLARAYRGNQQRNKAFTIVHTLNSYPDPQVKQWAESFISILQVEEKATNKTTPIETKYDPDIPLRTPNFDVKVPLPKAKIYLKIASIVTYFVIFLIWVIISFIGNYFIQPIYGIPLLTVLGLTLILYFGLLLISLWGLDFLQEKIYQVQWINLTQLRNYSSETATILFKICRSKKVKTPRLGIIDDRVPVIFTYGLFPKKARIIVTTGLLKSLRDEEIAAVYAHELGHVFQGNLAIMTMGTMVIQLTYIFYCFLKSIYHNNPKLNQILRGISCLSILPYLGFLLTNFLLFYLSRTREDYADHFAVEATGNPNGLGRALVKIAYALSEQKQIPLSPLIPMTRILGIYDAKAALIPGTAYRLTCDFSQVGQTFIWDIFNPWGMWLELNSPHPLIGKRIRTLMNYSQFLNLKNEFDMNTVLMEGNQLNKRKLYGNFSKELLIFNAQWIVLIGSIMIGLFIKDYLETSIGILSLGIIGFGVGLVLQTWIMYPKITLSSPLDLYRLICDPYGSPLTGYPVQFQGKLIGQSQGFYQLESTIMFQDSSGTVFAHYSSPLGALGNFFLSWTKTKPLINSEATIMGWLRRGISPWIDWSHLSSSHITLKHYPRFWSLIRGSGVIIVGLILLIYAIGTHRLTTG
ncbi:peptidase M48 Ste24p [Gloeothece citriformis PCC 7424]|uniref:Peptidase M48 Ste24p n=1 Tax=Gloeothece citriformis (strain PCC 7424) TaxID=65393 RepID=B7KI80_GLOC7|nr:M48 family metalloprotease [Gloeothece citriformis]ACK73567.1 peptidase M48 Ste24p [Gloeothece citriformis PCC 7424]